MLICAKNNDHCPKLPYQEGSVLVIMLMQIMPHSFKALLRDFRLIQIICTSFLWESQKTGHAKQASG